MKIIKETKDNAINITLEGRLDTVTAPELDKEVASLLEAGMVSMDFGKLQYVSSAGLRVLLKIQKAMNAKGGKFIIHGVNESVMEVFEMTGFADILTIE